MNYQFHIFCCINERPTGAVKPSCAANGSIELFDYFKSKVKVSKVELVRVNKAGCLDQCEKGPVIVIYPEAIWYKVTSKSDIDEIINSHLFEKKIVEKLRLRAE